MKARFNRVLNVMASAMEVAGVVADGVDVVRQVDDTNDLEGVSMVIDLDGCEEHETLVNVWTLEGVVRFNIPEARQVSDDVRRGWCDGVERWLAGGVLVDGVGLIDQLNREDPCVKFFLLESAGHAQAGSEVRDVWVDVPWRAVVNAG